MLRSAFRLRVAATRPVQCHLRPFLAQRPRFYATEEQNPIDQPAKPTNQPPQPTEQPPQPIEKVQEDSAERKNSETEKKPQVTEIEALSKEIAELKDKYLRSKADFQNLQDRTKREITAAKDYAIQKFAQDLMDTVDNFERALKTIAPEHREDSKANAELVDLYNGLKMTEEIMMKTLARHGLTKYDGIGQMFDPNVHEGIFEAPAPDKEPGTVFHCEQMGFMLNGRVMRPAKVGIVKASE